jgi:hypothetical protein
MTDPRHRGRSEAGPSFRCRVKHFRGVARVAISRPSRPSKDHNLAIRQYAGARYFLPDASEPTVLMLRLPVLKSSIWQALVAGPAEVAEPPTVKILPLSEVVLLSGSRTEVP